MAVKRLDHVVIVVDDLAAGVEFFRELGLELEGSTLVEGDWVDRVNGIADIRADITMMRMPDGNGRIELTQYRSPGLLPAQPHPAPPNVLGLRSVMFAVDDIDDVVARLQTRGGTLMGEIVNYEDVYRLCYLRGPGGAIVALAEELR